MFDYRYKCSRKIYIFFNVFWYFILGSWEVTYITGCSDRTSEICPCERSKESSCLKDLASRQSDGMFSCIAQICQNVSSRSSAWPPGLCCCHSSRIICAGSLYRVTETSRYRERGVLYIDLRVIYWLLLNVSFIEEENKFNNI